MMRERSSPNSPWPYQFILCEGDDIENDPADAQDGHEKIELIATRLPVADEAQCCALHHCLDEKQECEQRRDHGGDLRDLFVDLPRLVEQGAVEQHENGRRLLEPARLSDVEYVRAKCAILRSRRRTKGLHELDATFQVQPTTLINGQQRRSLNGKRAKQLERIARVNGTLFSE